MKTRAAVAFSPKQKLEIVELDLEGRRGHARIEDAGARKDHALRARWGSRGA